MSLAERDVRFIADIAAKVILWLYKDEDVGEMGSFCGTKKAIHASVNDCVTTWVKAGKEDVLEKDWEDTEAVECSRCHTNLNGRPVVILEGTGDIVCNQCLTKEEK